MTHDNQKATARPWIYQQSETGINYIVAINGARLATVESLLDGINNAEKQIEADANAELIVRAVNSHDVLVTALRELKEAVENNVDGVDTRQYLACEMEHAEQALAPTIKKTNDQ